MNFHHFSRLPQRPPGRRLRFAAMFRAAALTALPLCGLAAQGCATTIDSGTPTSQAAPRRNGACTPELCADIVPIVAAATERVKATVGPRTRDTMENMATEPWDFSVVENDPNVLAVVALLALTIKESIPSSGPTTAQSNGLSFTTGRFGDVKIANEPEPSSAPDAAKTIEEQFVALLTRLASAEALAVGPAYWVGVENLQEFEAMMKQWPFKIQAWVASAADRLALHQIRLTTPDKGAVATALKSGFASVEAWAIARLRARAPEFASNGKDLDSLEDRALINACAIVGCAPKVGCQAPKRTCSGACVDTSIDRRNCGACGAACPSSSNCVASKCQCNTAFPNACGGSCVDTKTDRANCGSCGNACPVGVQCVDSACKDACTVTKTGDLVSRTCVVGGDTVAESCTVVGGQCTAWSITKSGGGLSHSVGANADRLRERTSGPGFEEVGELGTCTSVWCTGLRQNHVFITSTVKSASGGCQTQRTRISNLDTGSGCDTGVGACPQTFCSGAAGGQIIDGSSVRAVSSLSFTDLRLAAEGHCGTSCPYTE